MMEAAADYERFSVRVVNTYPHDREAFTEGLVYDRGYLYESTGLEGASSLRRVALKTGEVIERAILEAELFGEGLALVDTQLVQLSWRSGRALVWDTEPLTLSHEHRYSGEGWGTCYDGERLIVSDGTAVLRFFAPEDFSPRGELAVSWQGHPIAQLNELECVAGDVFANLWRSPYIVRIDAGSGQVTGLIDGSNLPPDGSFEASIDELNGIAFMPEREHFLLTGKYWPALYEVELVPAP